MCVGTLRQLSEDERRRSDVRKQWLQHIVDVAESGAIDIEPVYRAVFAILRQVAQSTCLFTNGVNVSLTLGDDLPLPFSPAPLPSPPLPTLPPPSPPLPLEVGHLNPARGSGERC